MMEPDGREAQMADANRSQQVTLGCGTLILIALIVLFFSGRGGDDVKHEVQNLDSSVKQLKTAIDSQSDQIKALRQTLGEMRTKASPKEGAEKR
jgi:cell division protein FtsB